jgi:hypothetical protein
VVSPATLILLGVCAAILVRAIVLDVKVRRSTAGDAEPAAVTEPEPLVW